MWYPLWHRMQQRTKENVLRPLKAVLSWFQYRHWLSPTSQSSPEELRQMQRQLHQEMLRQALNDPETALRLRRALVGHVFPFVGGNAALASLLTALSQLGLITDNTTA